MQVAKWGNSLAVRLPKAVVEALGLKVGDEIEIEADSARRFVVRRGLTREEAMKRLEQNKLHLPPGFRLNREELYER